MAIDHCAQVILDEDTKMPVDVGRIPAPSETVCSLRMRYRADCLPYGYALYATDITIPGEEQ